MNSSWNFPLNLLCDICSLYMFVLWSRFYSILLFLFQTNERLMLLFDLHENRSGFLKNRLQSGLPRNGFLHFSPSPFCFSAPSFAIHTTLSETQSNTRLDFVHHKSTITDPNNWVIIDTIFSSKFPTHTFWKSWDLSLDWSVCLIHGQSTICALASAVGAIFMHWLVIG